MMFGFILAIDSLEAGIICDLLTTQVNKLEAKKESGFLDSKDEIILEASKNLACQIFASLQAAHSMNN